jgi:four helix bundle protein
VRDFRDLKVWQKAHALTIEVYRASKDFPRDEAYGLTSQVRRASVSIAANIVEGCGRNGDAGFARFLRIALGSAAELQYHLLLAKDLGLLRPPLHSRLEADVCEVKRMVTVFMRKLTPDRY